MTPARRLAQEGLRVYPVFYEGLRTYFLRRLATKVEMLQGFGIEATFRARVPRNFLGLNTWSLGRFLSDPLSKGPVVVHARGLQGAHSLLPLKKRHPNLKILCDVRGIESAEYELDIVFRKGRPLNPAETWWRNQLSRIEREAVAGSDGVICVSRSMIPLLSKRSGRPLDGFGYVPCAVEVDRFQAALSRRDAVRRDLGFDGKLVVVYTGSLSAWQIPEQMISIVKRFLDLRSDAVFFGISTEPEQLAALAKRAGIAADRAVCRKVPHADVAASMAAGDIGLLLREDNEVNRFACPTKFAEYLACGLHVLATPAVNEVAETIRSTGAGTLLESLENGGALDRGLRDAADRATAAGRADRSVAAARLYDWALHLPTLKKWYLDLASGLPR